MFGAINIDDMTKKVLSIKVGKTGYATVLQADGLAIIHPDKNVAMKVNSVTDPKLPGVVRAVHAKVIKGDRGIESYTYEGVSKIAAYAPVPGVKWFISINVPTAEVTESVAALGWISLTTILVVLILATIIIVFVRPQHCSADQDLGASGEHRGRRRSVRGQHGHSLQR